MKRLRINASISFCIFLAVSIALGADYPTPTSGDYVLHDFRFESGETLPELRIHYRTLGTPRTGTSGRVENAVLILHGTTGNGSNFLRKEFAGELFGPGQILDAAKYYLVLPDGIGHGQSSGRAMACTRSFHITVIVTWWRRSDDCCKRVYR